MSGLLYGLYDRKLGQAGRQAMFCVGNLMTLWVGDGPSQVHWAEVLQGCFVGIYSKKTK